MTGSAVDKSMFGTELELIEQARQDLPHKLKSMQEKVKLVLQQYFLSHSVEDCVQSLTDGGVDTCKDELLVLALRFTLDSEEEFAPVLLQRLVVEYFADEQSAGVRGLQKLLVSINDIEIDVPHAPEFLLHFIFFMVDEHLIEEAFLSRVPESLYARVEDPNSEEQLRDRTLPYLQELRTFKKKCSHILTNFAEHRNLETVKLFLVHTSQPMFFHEFVKKALRWALEAAATPGEEILAVVALLSKLYGEPLTTDDVQTGFVGVLGCLEDLVLDCPKLEHLVVELLCMSLVEEVCSGPFLHRCLALRIGGPLGVSVLTMVERRLPEFSRRLDTSNFKLELRRTILEYFDSHDENEVKRIVQELSFTKEMAAEFVRKLITFAMERSAQDCKLAVQLLEFLVRYEEITLDQIELGFSDLHKRMDDIVLDIPDALEITESIERQAKRVHLLDTNWVFTN